MTTKKTTSPLPSPAAAAEARTTPQDHKIRDEEIEYYLRICQGLLQGDLNLRLKKWRDVWDGKFHYQLVEEDSDTRDWIELSRSMNKSEIYENLFCLAHLFTRVEKVKWRRFLRAEQEQQAKRWSEKQQEHRYEK